MFLWMLGCSLWPVVMIGAVNVLLVVWRAVQEQEGKQRPNMEEFIGPEQKMTLGSLVAGRSRSISGR